MPGITCPDCVSRILIDDVHIAEGTASCRSCGRGYRLSQLVTAPSASRKAQAGMLEGPPPGCRIVDRPGEVHIIASTRSPGRAIAVLFAAILWNSITWVFVLLAAAGVWAHLAGPLPAWVPAPFSGKPHPMPLVMAVFLALFILPFVAIGAWLLVNFVVCCVGHVGVTVTPGAVETFIGVGRMGRRRRTEVGDGVVAVRVVRVRGAEQGQRAIEIGGSKKTRFGELLSEARREWVARSLREQLEPGRRDALPPRG